jgi:hypothetical protein
MANVVGEGFPDFTIEQIKQRQKIYGSINRNEQQLSYLEARTGWCKLISSVNVKKPLRNINLLEEDLAKAFVLFNGTTNEGTNIQRSGIWPGTGNPNNYAYGMGGTAYGLRPMPGIKSASTKTETRGSLKTSTIQIQANNKEQFDIIDTLYLRLGFSLLLEWGNSSYFDNNGTYIADNPNSLADEFLSGKLNYKNFSTEINKKRLNSCGNYDAIVGKVVNFNWTFTKDGTYDITVTLRSMGDVIESLKSNLLLPGSVNITIPAKVTEQQQEIEAEKAELSQDQKDLEKGKAKVAAYDAEIAAAEKVLADEKAALEVAKEKVVLLDLSVVEEGLVISIAAQIVASELKIAELNVEREIANSFYVKLNEAFVAKGKQDVIDATAELEKVKLEEAAKVKEEIAAALAEANPTPEEVIKAFSQAHEVGRYFYIKQTELSTQPTTSDTGLISIPETPINFFSQKYEGDNSCIQYYIRLGHFLEWIQTNLIPKVVPSIPLIKIDTNIDTNIIYLLGRQISSDPGICIFNTEIPFENSVTQFAPGTAPFEVFIDGSKNKYGQIMNSYFNMVYILTQLDSLKDKDGKVSIFDLVKSLCDGWNTATGNFNKLAPTIDADDNEMKITDEVSLPDRDSWLKKFNQKTNLASFDVFGYYYPLPGSKNSTGAGFIRDIKFNTTVPPNLATMITIGATANGYVVGQDATALSRMNAGLEDRFKEKIVLPTEQDIQTASSASINQDYVTALTDFNVFTKELGYTKDSSTVPIWNKEAISAFNTTAAQFYEYDQAKQTLAAAGEKNASQVALGQATASLKPWQKPASPNGGFLPFDLSLTMDGLSGMKVYQKYTIDTDYLPSNYPSSLEFLIKGITNTIQGNQWITNIESFAIPKNPFGSSVSKSPEAAASNPSTRGTAPSPVTYYQSNLPESQAKKRAVLTRILDDGTQTLGILEIFDADAKTIIYRLATVELPYKNNKNGESAVPTDTYLVNSRQTSKYGKHFWLVGGSKGDWKYIPGSNNSNREWVLIHTAPKAPGWLAGCIGPGPQFDFNTLNAKGNPNGVGTKYLNPAKSQSTEALNRLVDTLYDGKGFKLEIKNISSVLPTSIKDNTIKTLAADARYKDLFKGI